MVSNYIRKTNRGSYSKESLQDAVRAVKNGTLSGYQAAKAYGIPRMTIMDHVNNKRIKSKTLGRHTALSPEVEMNLASLLHIMERNGFGMTKNEVLEMVADYVRQNRIDTPFKRGMPGSAWFTSFKDRYKLSVKKPQAVEYARKKAVDPFIVCPYFNLLWETMSYLKITNKPSAIWNIDETSFSKDPQKTKLVGAKGHASTRTISSPGRDNTTVLLGGNANGDKLPPLIIYKGKNVWDAWVSENAYPGTTYAATQNGWMETEVFERYFKQVFLPAVGDQRPVLLIYDGHSTHVGLNIIREARKEGITILKLPAHTSHLLQPLDIAVMKSFKDRWDLMLVKWQRLHVGIALPKNEFARLIGEVWNQIEGQILRNGFRKAGIYPWDPSQISDSKFDQLQYQRWKSQQKEAVRMKEPQNLLALALDCVNASISTSNVAQETESQEKHVPETEKPNKITILEDKKITFEELLLLQIKPGNNIKTKRKKVASGAEVITHEEVEKRKIREILAKNIKTGAQARKTKIKIVPNKDKSSKKKAKVTTKATAILEHESDKENCDLKTHTSRQVTGNSDILYDGPSTSTGIRPKKCENILPKIKKEKNKYSLNKKIIPKNKEEKNKCTVNENTISKIKKEKNKSTVRKRVRAISMDSTSVSDCMSVHSDSDIFEYKENLVDNMTNDNQNEEALLESDEDDDHHNQNQLTKNSDILYDGPSTSTGIRPKKWENLLPKIKKEKNKCTVNETIIPKIKKEKNKSSVNENTIPKIKKEKNKSTVKKRVRAISMDSTTVSDCMSVHSDSDIFEYKENLVDNMTNDYQNEEALLESDEDDHNVFESYNIGDHVLVRYYNRKTWKHYVGFIEDMKEEEYYTVRFYKTIKKTAKTNLKFVLAQKVDRDNVPRPSIVKKIEMRKDPLNSKNFLLYNDDDSVYFS